MSIENLDSLRAKARRLESDTGVMQSHLQEINSYPQSGLYLVSIDGNPMKFQTSEYAAFIRHQLSFLHRQLWEVNAEIKRYEQCGT